MRIILIIDNMINMLNQSTIILSHHFIDRI